MLPLLGRIVVLGNVFFRFLDVQVTVNDLLQGFLLLLGIQGQQGTAVSFGDGLLLQFFLNFLIKGEQAELVGDGGLGSAEPLGQLLLRLMIDG